MDSKHFSRIFLLSHMRAYTSVLGHILGSHPAINGYFELHISYDDESALDEQVTELCKYETLKDNSRYLFDKLLHNDYRLMLERLGLGEKKILISVREPEHSIKSIVDLFARKEAEDSYRQPEAATSYYIERVGWLCEFCRSAAFDYYYFDAETARRKPEQLLPALTRWLDLDAPLSERYNTFSQTGRPRKGDSSTRIRSGAIDKSPSDYSHIHLSEELLERALSAYRQGRQAMIDHSSDRILN